MTKGSNRSAVTGRYVTRATAARHPRTTVTERGSNNNGSGTHHRSAITGHYITPATAARVTRAPPSPSTASPGRSGAGSQRVGTAPGGSSTTAL